MKWLSSLVLALSACVSAPNIVVIDRATALEMEAAGQYPKLDHELERSALLARPTPVTREQLEAAGQPRPIVEVEEPSDPERIDALEKTLCIGEALDGRLLETRDTCSVKEIPHLGALLERANRDRAQLWEWLRAQRPNRSVDEVRSAWRAVHLRGVPCGGQVQKSDLTWEPKRC